MNKLISTLLRVIAAFIKALLPQRNDDNDDPQPLDSAPDAQLADTAD